MLKNISLTIMIISLMIASAFIAQFAQFTYSLSDVRNKEMALWAGNDDKRISIVRKFTEKCLKSNPIKNENNLKNSIFERPVSIYECANNEGFGELESVIKNADSTLKSYSWPISTTNQKLKELLI